MLMGTCEPWPRKIKQPQEIQKIESSRRKGATIYTLIVAGMQRHKYIEQMHRCKEQQKLMRFNPHSPSTPVLPSQCGEGSA